MPTSKKVYNIVAARSGGMCEACHRRPAVTMHHVGGRGMGGTKKIFTEEDLQFLCLKCHLKVHGIKEE